MSVNADAAGRRASLGVFILPAILQVGPSPPRADHKRLQIVGTGKTQRDRPAVAAIVFDLMALDGAAGGSVLI